MNKIELPSNNTNSTKPRRNRVSVACEACRRKKIKCDGVKPTCKGCTQSNISCIYATPVIPSSNGNRNALPQRPNNGPGKIVKGKGAKLSVLDDRLRRIEGLLEIIKPVIDYRDLKTIEDEMVALSDCDDDDDDGDEDIDDDTQTDSQIDRLLNATIRNSTPDPRPINMAYAGFLGLESEIQESWLLAQQLRAKKKKSILDSCGFTVPVRSDLLRKACSELNELNVELIFNPEEITELVRTDERVGFGEKIVQHCLIALANPELYDDNIGSAMYYFFRFGLIGSSIMGLKALFLLAKCTFHPLVVSVTVRLAQESGLHSNRFLTHNMGNVDRERVRRLWWGIFCVERASSQITGSPPLINTSTISQSLPTYTPEIDPDEATFNQILNFVKIHLNDSLPIELPPKMLYFTEVYYRTTLMLKLRTKNFKDSYEQARLLIKAILDVKGVARVNMQFHLFQAMAVLLLGCFKDPSDIELLEQVREWFTSEPDFPLVDTLIKHITTCKCFINKQEPENWQLTQFWS